MDEKSIQFDRLSLDQLNDIMQEGITGTNSICLLYDAAGQLILRASDRAWLKNASRTTQAAETAEIGCQAGQAAIIGRQAALAAINGHTAVRQSDRRCSTEIIEHQKRIQGVLVGWSKQPTDEPREILLREKLMCITRRRIEEALNIQDEIDRLSAELIDEYRALALIHSLSTVLVGLEEINQVYQLTLEQVIEIVDADRGYIFKLDESSSELSTVQCYPHTVDHDGLPLTQRGESFIDTAVQAGQSILIEDTKHPLWDNHSSFRFTPPLICCPLQIGKTPLGAIVVEREATKPSFESSDLKILESAALQPAAAMMNVSLLEELRASNQELQQEIIRRKQIEEKLQYKALHDSLTGLANRALFLDHLKRSIDCAKRRKDYLFAVLFLDLNRFKVINDSLGHTIGDELLIAIAGKLKSCLRPEDTIARLGGDEFTILLGEIRDFSDATRVAERIHGELALPLDLGGHEVFASTSVGIVLSGPDYNQPEDLLRDADIAMYRSKAHGSRYEVFDREMHGRAISRLELETDLRRGIEREEFQVHYQPLVSLETSRISGFEALVRWQPPGKDIVSPADFIPAAEETGLIVPIGDWVLREACHQMRTWQSKFSADPPLTINVNLSVKQFMQPTLVKDIDRILSETNLDPRNLNLEITESLIMEDTSATATMLSRLKDLDIKLQMDDFGTGYSSLSYLHRFPIDTLKIDRSFISNMGADRKNSEIVQTILMLAQNLGMDATAEGVETSAQLTELRSMACERGQGYYFSKPLDAIATEDLLRAQGI